LTFREFRKEISVREEWVSFDVPPKSLFYGRGPCSFCPVFLGKRITNFFTFWYAQRWRGKDVEHDDFVRLHIVLSEGNIYCPINENETR